MTKTEAIEAIIRFEVSACRGWVTEIMERARMGVDERIAKLPARIALELETWERNNGGDAK